MKCLPLRLLVLVVVLSVPAMLATPAWAQRSDSVYMEDRLNQLQQSITVLTGQIEQLQYQNQQLQQQLEKMQTDYEFRIDQLEKGKGGGGHPPPGPTAPPPGPRAGLAPPAGPPPAGGPTANGANADQIYRDSMKMMLDGDYAGAEQGFKTFVQRFPQHVLAGNAQYWLGESYYARHQYQNAAVAFAEGYKTYRSSQKGPDNLLKLGITLSVMGKKQEACAMFARFSHDYPKATDLQKRRIDQERQKNSCG